MKKSTEEEKPQNLASAQQIKIMYCSCIGRFQINKCRPISVTFLRREDKEDLMSAKSTLSHGIYINNEYPLHIKQNQDRLRPIFKMVKSHQDYHEKCKMDNDILVINGICYSINDVGQLPKELTAYKAAKKTNNDVIAFHGEFSPFSNFHRSPFTVNDQSFHSSQQFIQYQKALLSGDSYTANKVLQCDTPLAAKKLGCKINGFDNQHWKSDGYSICLEGIRAKFIQNHNLLQMLKATSPKLLVEANTDCT